MFDQMKNMGKLLKDAKKMKDRMKDVQSKLKNTVIKEQSDNGDIKVEMTGELDIVNLVISDDLLEKGANTLSSRLKTVLNKAIVQAKQLATSQLTDVSKGLDLPGLT